MRPVFLVSLLALTACDPARTADAGLDAAMADAGAAIDVASPIDAPTVPTPPVPYYEVPTTDPSLAPHVFFAVPDVHYVVSAGMVTLTYDFPPDLSGVIDQPISFTGPVDAAGNATISGPTGTGTCVASGDIVRCTEIFSAGLMLDTATALSGTSTYSADPAAQAARASVIEVFASDPIGVVVFDRIIAGEVSGGD